MKRMFLFFAVALCLTACNNDDEPIVNETVTIDGETYDVVKLALTRTADTPLDGSQLPEELPLDFYLRNDQTLEISVYKTTLRYDGEQVHCEMLVSQEAPLADGTYKLLMVLHGAKKRFPFILELAFQGGKCVAVGKFTPIYGRKLGSGNEEEGNGLRGKGTRQAPYEIYTYRDLLILHNSMKNDLTKAEGIYFVQKRSIDLNGYYDDPNRVNEQGWAGIADGFSGIYDGSGMYINGLYSESQQENVGLFSSLGKGAEIKDLSLSSVSIQTTSNRVGAIAGSSTGPVKLSGINVSGLINGGKLVGGLIGEAQAPIEITLCSNEGLALMGQGETGGLVGRACKGITLTSSTLMGNITSTGDYTGGAVGYASDTITLDDVDNKREIHVQGKKYTGGVMGYANGIVSANKLKIDKSATESTTTNAVEGSDNVGGLFGELHAAPGSQLTNCYVQMRIKGSDNVGGFIGSLKGSAAELPITDGDTGALGWVNGDNYTGGIIGKAEIKVNLSNTQSNRYELPVTGTNNYTGGLIGRFNAASFTNVIAAANVTGNQRVGGFFGEGNKPAFVNSLTDSLIHVQGYNMVGGLGGSVSYPILPEGSTYSALVNPDDEYAEKAENAGGLFGYANGIKLTGITVKSRVRGINRTGGVVGHTDKEVTLTNVTNYSGIKGVDHVGGIIGLATNGSVTLDAVYNLATITEGAKNVAGIIGKSESSYTLTNVHNRANITCTGNRAAGIVGYSYNKGSLDYCSNTGNISGNSYVGGIIGTTEDDHYKDTKLSVLRCANKGSVTAQGKAVGGIIGFVYGEFTVRESYNTGQQKGVENIGGIIGEVSGYYHSGKELQSIYDCYNRANSSGDEHRGGILGYKGADIAVNTFYIFRCCNYGKTGYGTIGGVSNRCSYEYGSLYYVDSNKDDFPTESHRYSLEKFKTMDVTDKLSDVWEMGADNLPVLKNAP